MQKIISFFVFSLLFACSLHADHFTAQELGEKLYAVHATDIFPAEGVAYAGVGPDEELPENFPNYRFTLHFALGELVRPLGDDWKSWEDKKYAVVTPLKTLFPQLVNLNCYDTFIVGDFVFDAETVLVAPLGTKSENRSLLIYEYDENSSLREAVDAVIALKGGWKVTMLGEDLEHEYPPAMLGDLNINTHDHFRPILELLPHLSLGLRWRPFHGEAWRFADNEMVLMGGYRIFYNDPAEVSADELHYFRERLLENYEVISTTYLKAPRLALSGKESILKKLNLMERLLQFIQRGLKAKRAEAA